MKKVSIVIPVYFNELNIPHLLARLIHVADEAVDYEFDFVFVDDGSEDLSYELLHKFAEKDARATALKLSRNFGSFTALLAGLTYASGDCAVIISADLQEPPELIPEMVTRWEDGNEVVMAVRKHREDPYFIRIFSGLYYRMMRKYALPDMPKGGFDFVLIDRKIIDILTSIKEKNTSLMGLILWSGFRRSILYYTRKKREHGRSMWTIRKKMKYFIDSFVSFSYAPIRFMQYAGVVSAFSGFAYALFIAIRKLIYGFPVPGLSALLIINLFIGGLQFIMMGILGEYLWRNVDETKKRPIFIVDKVFNKSQSDLKHN